MSKSDVLRKSSFWKKWKGWDQHTKLTDMLPLTSKTHNAGKQGAMGAAAGAGLSAAKDKYEGKDVSAKGIALGALLGGTGGYVAGHVNHEFMKKLRKKEQAIVDKEFYKPYLFGKKKHKAELDAMKDDLYKKGVKEYYRRALIAGGAPTALYLGVDKITDVIGNK